MTTEEIDALSGRELDVAVAKSLGWRIFSIPRRGNASRVAHVRTAIVDGILVPVGSRLYKFAPSETHIVGPKADTSYFDDTEEIAIRSRCPSYSTDPRAAAEVKKAIVAKGWFFTIGYHRKHNETEERGWSARIYAEEFERGCYTPISEETALCRAFVKACQQSCV